MKRHEIHVYANPTIDVIGAEMRAGGPGLYAGRAASILGFSVRVYGGIGVDGLSVVKDYMDAGVLPGRIILHLDEKTTRFRLEYKGQKRILMVEHPGPKVSSTPLRSPRVVAPVLQEFERRLLIELVADAYVDIQGVVRRYSRGLVELTRAGECDAVLERSLLVKGDVAEMMVCIGASTPAELVEKARRVSLTTPLLVTLGYRGALYFEKGVAYYVRAWGPLAEDPTGMGDVMISSIAYLHSYLHREVLDAVRLASVVCGLHAKRQYSSVDVEVLERLAPEYKSVDMIEAKRLIEESFR